jgi:hypothetical protein
MNPMMGRGQDDMTQESKPGIFKQVLSHMDKSTPGTVYKHDEKKERWVYTGQNANGCSYYVSIRRLKKKVSVSDRKIHRFRSMMGRMQAPE